MGPLRIGARCDCPTSSNATPGIGFYETCNRQRVSHKRARASSGGLMSRLRRVGGILPVALGALVVALMVAVVVARHKRSSPAAPAIVNGARDKSPTKAAFSADATYGTGLTKVVRSPVASLRPTLGEAWRELGRSVGRVLLRPNGIPSRYFEVSAVAVVRTALPAFRFSQAKANGLLNL